MSEVKHITQEELEDCKAWKPSEETAKEFFKTIYGDNAYENMLQHINITIPLTREKLFELGKKGPYHRYIEFPPEQDYVAYTIPNCNKIPDRHIMGDVIKIDFSKQRDLEAEAKQREQEYDDVSPAYIVEDK